MRYKINFDRLVNQLVPYYLGGRKLILYLQACIHPLKAVNKIFVEWAKETRIEAAMTSQVFKLEWFLNRKFQKYFEDPNAKISINNSGKTGKAIYYQSAQDIPDSDQMTLYQSDETDAEHTVLYYDDENTESTIYSFIVHCPKLWKSESSELLKDGITESEFVRMLTYYINRYKISGKTYNIVINQ